MYHSIKTTHFTTQPSLQWFGICQYVNWGPGLSKASITIKLRWPSYRIVVLSRCRGRTCNNTITRYCASISLSCCRIVTPNNATIRQHDSVHLSHYRVIALSGATMRQYDSARLLYYRIVGDDNAITRLYDRVGAMASLSHHSYTKCYRLSALGTRSGSTFYLIGIHS